MSSSRFSSSSRKIAAAGCAVALATMAAACSSGGGSSAGTAGASSGGDTGTVTVNGTGVAGGHLTATSVTHNWGTIAVGTSGGNYGVEITNSTASAVTLSFSGLTGGSSGFSVVGTTCGASLAVNANCELMFTFTPNATGFVSGTYPITSSSPLYFSGNPVSPSQITLEGTGD